MKNGFRDDEKRAATKFESDNDPARALKLTFESQPMPMTETTWMGQVVLIGRVTFDKVLIVPSEGFPHWHYYTVVRPASDERG